MFIGNKEKVYIKYTTITIYKGINIKISDFYKHKELKKIQDYVYNTIDFLEENILMYLIINNFTINIVSPKYLKSNIFKHLYGQNKKRLKKEGLLNKRAGIYIWGRKEVFLIYNKNDIERLLLHEIAHFLDYQGEFNIVFEDIIKMKKLNKQNFRRTHDADFYEIYNSESIESGFKNHNVKSYYEYFAECFAIYILNKNKNEVKKFKDRYKRIDKLEKSCCFIESFIKSFK